MTDEKRRPKWFLGYRPGVPRPTRGDLQRDLEEYRQMALDMGAEDARIIPASDVEIGMHIRASACYFPRCPIFGTNLHCQPRWNAPWADIKKIVASFEYAIVFRTTRRPDHMSGPVHLTLEQTRLYARYLDKPVEQVLTERGYPVRPIPTREEGLQPFRGVQSVGGTRIVAAIERQARRDGHYFSQAMGSGGSCPITVCREYGAACVGLKTGICRFPGRSRPTGTGCWGLDYIATAGKQGWKMPLAGFSVHAEDYPEGAACYSPAVVLIE